MTPGSSVDDPVGSARAALARGDWEQARAGFEAVLAHAADPAAFEGLATACSMLADGDAALAARERAYALYREQGEPLAAARTALWLAIDSLDFRYEAAIANGWIQRANRLLEGTPPGVELGLVRLIEGHLALMADNDLVTALARAAEGRAISDATGSADLEALSLGLEGLARVSEGDLRRGMPLVDEAAAAALGGELRDLAAIGQSCCYLIHACERVRDFERAAQWCAKVRAFCERWRYTTLFTVCRTQYASVLMYRGEWAAAEAELSAALRELQATRPAASAPALVRMAELRRRQGRFDEAAALFESVRGHRMAVLGRGELALDRGDARGALDLAEQALRRVPPASRTERVAGLDLQARAAGALGDAATLDVAATELDAIAGVIDTEPLRATAALARGLAHAPRDPEQARRCLEDAAAQFEHSSMPFEAAHAQRALARVLAGAGREAAARTASREAAAILARLGSVRAPQLDVEWKTPAASPLTAREREVLRLVADGLADKEMADRLHLSSHTIHRHVSNILTKLGLPSRAAAVAYASRLGLLD